ncbi:MAG: transcription elongation factor GreB [Oligoflexia bacterium]|nr:transcription elongation factor GreB [Oligoflexia bacterium]
MLHNEEDDLTDSDLDNDEDGDEGGSSPDGYKNYITPNGFQKLKTEYQKLFHDERPKLVETIAWAASNGDRSENGDYIYGKRRLREIDRRLKFLGKRMASAVVVELGKQSKEQVLFGAKVTVEDEDGRKLSYQIVGEDEIDIESRKISWVSPVAKALMNAQKGSHVIVQRPNGETELKILKIEYPEDGTS